MILKAMIIIEWWEDSLGWSNEDVIGIFLCFFDDEEHHTYAHTHTTVNPVIKLIISFNEFPRF